MGKVYPMAASHVQLSLFPPISNVKSCRTCGTEKPLDQFGKHACEPDGLRSACKECTRRQDKQRAKSYREQKQQDSPTEKKCPKCSTVQPLDNFSLNKSTKDGRSGHCKKCTNEYHHNTLAHHRSYKNARRQDPTYRKQERERIQAWRHENAERMREQSRQRYATDADFARRVRANTKAWMVANPLKVRQMARKYHAKKRQVTIEDVDYERILERDGPWCYICGQGILPDHSIEFDHVIPISRGGTHSEENIRPTHEKCNRRKGDKLVHEMSSFQKRGIV